MIHTLKCWPVYFQAIVSGQKTFDIRRGEDRSYEANDYLDLKEWDPDRQAYTGAHCVKRVVYVMHGEPFAPAGTWVLGLSQESRFPDPGEFRTDQEQYILIYWKGGRAFVLLDSDIWASGRRGPFFWTDGDAAGRIGELWKAKHEEIEKVEVARVL